MLAGIRAQTPVGPTTSAPDLQAQSWARRGGRSRSPVRSPKPSRPRRAAAKMASDIGDCPAPSSQQDPRDVSRMPATVSQDARDGVGRAHAPATRPCVRTPMRPLDPLGATASHKLRELLEEDAVNSKRVVSITDSDRPTSALRQTLRYAQSCCIDMRSAWRQRTSTSSGQRAHRALV